MTDNDIGYILAENKLPIMSDNEKYNILVNHFRPHRSFLFPKTEMRDGKKRSFQYEWLNIFQWMVYSKSENGAFCLPCSLFAKNREMKKSFVNTPFLNWTKMKEKANCHQQNDYHSDSVLEASNFLQSRKLPENCIDVRLDRQKNLNIEKNREILKHIIQGIIYCSKQGIALRGHRENLEGNGNPGNFLAMLKVIASYNNDFKEHLKSPAMRNATYISPKIQNELIDIIAHQIIQKKIIDEIKEAKFFSIIADEVTSHNVEILSFCVRFIDSAKNVREEFLEFLQIDRITGEFIAQKILQIIDKLGLDIKNVVGQSYDGAANMASERVGVQARIKTHAPKAVYVHCNSHCLNLVIAQTSRIMEVRNMFDRLKDVCLFFLNSPKREGLLLEIAKKDTENDLGRRKILLDLCRTRWAMRHKAYQHFYQNYSYIVETLESIVYGGESEKYFDTPWSAQCKRDALAILNSITSFPFLITFITSYQYLSHLEGITVKLQGRSMDIVEAYRMVKDIIALYATERNSVDEGFEYIYEKAISMGKKHSIEPSVPRISKKQVYRSNIECDSILNHYKINLAIPFLDCVITNLKSRFSRLEEKAISLLSVLPPVFLKDKEELEEIEKNYHNELPSPELLVQEMKRWKAHFQSYSEEDIPKTPAAALKCIDECFYPNISVLLRIAATLPVTSCECERSASSLRKLDDYNRATMTDERKSSLALIHIHYDENISIDEVINIFSRLHPRKLQLENMLND